VNLSFVLKNKRRKSEPKLTNTHEFNSSYYFDTGFKTSVVGKAMGIVYKNYFNISSINVIIVFIWHEKNTWLIQQNGFVSVNR